MALAAGVGIAPENAVIKTMYDRLWRVNVRVSA